MNSNTTYNDKIAATQANRSVSLKKVIGHVDRAVA
jgi:hypothetical protein